MSSAPLHPPGIPRLEGATPRRKRFTRADVEKMLDSGLFHGQSFELVNGDLIDKIGQKPSHATAIHRLMICLAEIFGLERVRVRLPIEVSNADRDVSWPEPDVAVLADAKEEYSKRHPNGDELLLLVEVADTTVAWDAQLKRDIYALRECRSTGLWIFQAAVC